MNLQNILKEFPLILLSGISTLFIYGFIRQMPELTLENTGHEELLEFDVVRVLYRDISRDIEGLGNLVYYDKATVISRIDGIVGKIYVKKGESVEKRDIILELSNSQLELKKKIEKLEGSHFFIQYTSHFREQFIYLIRLLYKSLNPTI